jgi:hypothetical protein
MAEDVAGARVVEGLVERNFVLGILLLEIKVTPAEQQSLSQKW